MSQSKTPIFTQKNCFRAIWSMRVVPLVGAGLMIRSFIRLQAVSLGFKPDHVLTMELSFPESKYAHSEQRKIMIERVIDRLGVLPGVKCVSATTLLPLAGGNFNSANGNWQLDGASGKKRHWFQLKV
jgi:hypothetical protein